MNVKQRKTLAMILEKPTRSDISWQETVSLLLGIGAVMKEGKRSRVRFKCRDYSLHVHAPHPIKVISKSTVETMRGGLTDIGVAP
jgi:hypothetical protein